MLSTASEAFAVAMMVRAYNCMVATRNCLSSKANCEMKQAVGQCAGDFANRGKGISPHRRFAEVAYGVAVGAGVRGRGVLVVCQWTMRQVPVWRSSTAVPTPVPENVRPPISLPLIA